MQTFPTNEFIDVVDGVAGPRPVVRGTKIRVDVIAGLSQSWDWSAGDIADNYPQISVEQARALLTYFAENEAAFARQRAADDALAGRGVAANPPLGERLRNAVAS